MKKIIIASGLLALMAAATSCDKYDIYDDQYGDVLLIKDGGDISMDVYSTDDYVDRYISVIKGGHSPERTSHATLRVMTDEDFAAYKEINYGNADFGGLQMIDPTLYDLIGPDGQVTKSVNYTFSGSNDRYFGATLRIYSDKFCKWYEDYKDQLNEKNFVLPIGLYSETDSVNEYNNVLMVTLTDHNPSITYDVTNGGVSITELSRRQLIADKGKGLVFEPEVYVSVPCKNTWGFSVRIAESKPSMVPEYADDSKSVPLQALRNQEKDENKGLEQITRWELTDKCEFEKKNDPNDVKEFACINFPVGTTKARVPLRIYLDNLDPDEMLNKNLMVPIKIENPRTGYAAIKWDDPENTPSDKVKETFIEPNQFYIGFKIIETPIDLDATCVTTNDPEPKEGSIAALFDDDLSTFFHSGWSVANERSAPFGSYLEFTLPEDINSVYINITARSSGNVISPKEIELWYTNDIDDEESWQKIETSPKKLTVPTLKAGQSYEIGKINKMYTAPEKFRYLRFCVITNQNNKSMFGPSNGTDCWNLAELKLYGKVQE